MSTGINIVMVDLHSKKIKCAKDAKNVLTDSVQMVSVSTLLREMHTLFS